MEQERDPFWLTIARRKLGVGPDWDWCRLEAVDKSSRRTRKDVLVTGGIPTVMFKSGPRKGRPNWKSVERQVAVVTEEEVAAEAAAYEAKTGNCSECFGAGKVVSGFDKGGTTYRDCSKCRASGRVPVSSTRQE